MLKEYVHTIKEVISSTPFSCYVDCFDIVALL